MIITLCKFQREQGDKWEAGLAIDSKIGWDIFDRDRTLVAGDIWDLVIRNAAYFTLDVSPIMDLLQDIIDGGSEKSPDIPGDIEA